MKSSSHQKQAFGNGQRHWFRLTGLPGWRRARLGLPAFGDAHCSATADPDRKHSRSRLTDRFLRKPLAVVKRWGEKVPVVLPETNKNLNRRSNVVWRELQRHAPFTALGTLSGALVLGLLIWTQAPQSVSTTLFWTLHPIHVLLSALVTTAMFRLHGGQGFWATVGIGYLGSIGIATASDCLLPYAGEWLIDLPHRGLHLGFIEKWWLVNPLAVGGIIAGFVWPHTRFPHAGHVLLSTWASLFHITMALGTGVSLADGALIALFLFLAVWLPCCTSDIVLPLLFTPRTPGNQT